MPCRQEPNGDMDGIPTVFMEAMATGRPVISSALSGIPELVRDGETGLVFDHRAPDADVRLADALACMLGDAGLRRALAARGQEAVRRFDYHESAQTVLAVLAALVV